MHDLRVYEAGAPRHVRSGPRRSTTPGALAPELVEQLDRFAAEELRDHGALPAFKRPFALLQSSHDTSRAPATA